MGGKKAAERTAFESEMIVAKRCKVALDALPYAGQLAVLALIERHVRDNGPAPVAQAAE